MNPISEADVACVDSDQAYVGFIDVLGFGSLIESEFDRAVRVYEDMLESSEVVERLRPDVSFRALSDAFILSSPSLSRLVGAVQGLLMQTLFNDCMVRGGIGFGRHVEKTENGQLRVVSQALVRAVRMEKLVRFPCVALDPDIPVDPDWWPPDVPNQYRGLLYFDGLRIVNPCNVSWGQSAMVRAWQLREEYPAHAAKYDWFLRLYEAIRADTPLIPSAAQQGTAPDGGRG